MARVMLSCGEASGDLYAAALIRSMRELDPTVEVFGFGGDRMAAAGADLIGDYRGLSVTGLVEALSVLRQSWTMLRRLEEAARTHRPDVFVAIDFPDFNFRLLPAMRRLGIPSVYYISPQLWAWRSGRMKTIRANVDRMLVIFPFERALYKDARVPVEFVGHPLIDLVEAAAPRAVWLREQGLDPNHPTIALLPGSRANELRQMLPIMAAGVRRAAASVPRLQCIVARAPSLDDHLYAAADELRIGGVPVAVVTGATDQVLTAADAVVTASGTATVQTALHRKPMVIVYRLAPLTYFLAKRFVQRLDVRHGESGGRTAHRSGADSGAVHPGRCRAGSDLALDGPHAHRTDATRFVGGREPAGRIGRVATSGRGRAPNGTGCRVKRPCGIVKE